MSVATAPTQSERRACAKATNSTSFSRTLARVQVTHNSAGESCPRANLAAQLPMLKSIRNNYNQ
jgi:hypothetical protein